METAINKVMYAYALLHQPTPGELETTRERLTAHLAGLDGGEEVLALEGMRYLRGADKVSRRRTVQKKL